MALDWQEGYKIGDAAIDAQHKELFHQINGFLGADDRESKILWSISLFRHTRDHFEYEESLMRRIRYPEIGEHFRQHTDLIAKLNAFSERVAEDRLNNMEFEIFLRNWLLDHMEGSDAKLAVYVNKL